jgi:hypothetical protein
MNNNLLLIVCFSLTTFVSCETNIRIVGSFLIMTTNVSLNYTAARDKCISFGTELITVMQLPSLFYTPKISSLLENRTIMFQPFSNSSLQIGDRKHVINGNFDKASFQLHLLPEVISWSKTIICYIKATKQCKSSYDITFGTFLLVITGLMMMITFLVTFVCLVIDVYKQRMKQHVIRFI